MCFSFCFIARTFFARKSKCISLSFHWAKREAREKDVDAKCAIQDAGEKTHHDKHIHEGERNRILSLYAISAFT